MSDTLAERTLLILPYGGVVPAFAAPPLHAGAMSAVLGRATVGAGAWIGDYAVVRADGEVVRIGVQFRLGSGSTVHIAQDLYPAIVGDRVTVGRDSVIHACTVGDDCVVGDGVVILDGSHVDAGAVLESGSIVYPRSHLPGGFLYAGRPAKAVRPLRAGEAQAFAERIRGGETSAAPLRAHWTGAREHRGGVAGDAFVAATARVRGDVDLAAASSIWFGCDLDAGACGLSIGARSNIQDNTVVRCERVPFALAAGSAIGHNVRLGGCTIGEGSLVGMGSTIAEGTTIAPDVLVAAGTKTEPGQELSSGYLWGGSPARPLSALNDARRAVIAGTVENYVRYAAAFAAAQRRTA